MPGNGQSASAVLANMSRASSSTRTTATATATATGVLDELDTRGCHELAAGRSARGLSSKLGARLSPRSLVASAGKRWRSARTRSLTASSGASCAGGARCASGARGASDSGGGAEAEAGGERWQLALSAGQLIHLPLVRAVELGVTPLQHARRLSPLHERHEVVEREPRLRAGFSTLLAGGLVVACTLPPLGLLAIDALIVFIYWIALLLSHVPVL